MLAMLKIDLTKNELASTEAPMVPDKATLIREMDVLASKQKAKILRLERGTKPETEKAKIKIRSEIIIRRPLH